MHIGSGTFDSTTSIGVGIVITNTGLLTVLGNLVNQGRITGPLSTNGTISGIGSYGSITIQSGGTLSPGNSPGILEAASLTLSSNATLHIEIDGPAYNQYDKGIVSFSLFRMYVFVYI